LNDDKTTEIGNPNIQGAKVEASILKNIKNKTILVFKKKRRKNSRKKYGHSQPDSLIRITKIFSKNGKLISQAGPKKQITKEIVKANQARKEQMFEAKKTKIEEHKKIKKRLELAQEKLKLKTKKSDAGKKKITSKKKPLTTKKK